MQIAVCLLPERELAAELVVFSQMHAAGLGGVPLSLTSNRPRLVLCEGDLDDWSITPELLADLSPAEPFRARFGAIEARDGLVIAPLGLMDQHQRRGLVGLQARATVRLGLQLPTRWVPGLPLGRTDAERVRPALRADWTTTMEGREVVLGRLAFLRVGPDGRASTTIASHAFGA